MAPSKKMSNIEGGKGGGGGGSESREINEISHDSCKFLKVFTFHVKSVRDGTSGTICDDRRVQGSILVSVQGAKPPEPQKFGVFGVPNRGRKPLS